MQKEDLTVYVGYRSWNLEIVNYLVRYFSDKYNVIVKDLVKVPLTNKSTTELWYALKRSFVLQFRDDFYLFEFDDMSHFKRTRDIVSNDRCIKVLKAQYSPTTTSHKVMPYTYFARRPLFFEQVVDALYEMSKTKCTNQLYFKGSHKHRMYLIEEMGDMLMDDWRTRLSLFDYYKELAEQKIALSIPGHGNFTHREIECFGMGVPVIMPRLLNEYYNVLIPDYHYISVETEVPYDCGETPDNCKAMATAIKEKYNEVKDDDELLKTIAGNAKRWYEENVAYPGCMRVTERILNLEEV